jgi:2-polyprenyl-3-methyl-5-hydroxy-6-metoxy-1,4-benzoquinol methylase
VAQSYSPEYYGSASSKFLTIIETALYWIKARQARKITQLWQRGLPAEGAPSVLDIGCGRGQLLTAFHAGGATVLGLERQEFPLHDLPGTTVRSGSLADPEYAGTTFDIIILWHVLEHLELQAQLLDVITEHLNVDGLLIIAVPNFASLQQRLFGKYWFHLDLPRHLVHLESNWLQNQLRQRGFTIEAVSYLDSLQNTYGFIQSAMNALVPLRLNEYYRLLKHGRARNPMAILRLFGWSMLALLLLPFAMLDNLWGTLLRNGATVQIAARNKSMR